MRTPRIRASLLAAALCLALVACRGDEEPTSPAPTAPDVATPTATATEASAVTPTDAAAPTPTASQGAPTPTDAQETPTAPPDETPSGTPPEPTEPPDTPTPPPAREALSVTVTWRGDSPNAAVDVTIHDPAGRTGFSFGMAETGAGSVGWYGEGCYQGTGNFHLCHEIPGDTLHLEQVSALGSVEEGETTLFWAPEPLTYYLEAPDGDCWAWGHDPHYYDALGCERLTPDGAPWVRRDRCSGMDPADVAPLGGWVALTFDDGPSSTVTPQILTVLRRQDVPATFFVLGERVSDESTWPVLEEAIDDPLFDVADHSWDHADMASLSILEVEDEIEDTAELLRTFDVEPTAFRFPYGSSTCETADLARDLGYLVAGWHIDTGDWCYAAVGKKGECLQDDYWRIPPEYEDDMAGWTIDQITRNDGGVVLFHDIHQYTADSLEAIIIELKREGYQFVSLDDAAALPRYNADDPFDFPWMGEACDTRHDTCWEVEYLSSCEATGAPGAPAGQGVCVLPCLDDGGCVDRDGTAHLFCAATEDGGRCLAYAEAINGQCGDVPGTVASQARRYPNLDRTALVCAPWGMVGELE